MKNLPFIGAWIVVFMFSACEGKKKPQTESVVNQTKTSVQSSPCNKNTAKMLGRLYYLSNPYNVLSDPSSVTNFVREYSQYLQNNSPTMQCCRLLGERLVNQGMAGFDKGDYDRGYAGALEMGATPDMARDVGNGMVQGSVDVYMMGEELLWLSEVIPSAANGNWTEFNNTGTQMRQQFMQVWPIYQMILNDPNYSDPYTKDMMSTIMQQIQPIVEDQVSMMVMMMGS